MSHSVSLRPLSLVPFFVADGVLLFAAWLIAWRTPDALSGGALVGVVVCTCLGALLTVLPFLLREARERDALLVKRQGELATLVESSIATTSRWGAQWAAAATGLEDAAGLASRNILAAERLPAFFQEKIDALATRLGQFEEAAQARDQQATRQDEMFAARAAEVFAAADELHRTLADVGRRAEGLREQHGALDATLRELPAAIARVHAARETFDERLSAAPALIDAHVERAGSQVEARFAALTDAFASRVSGLETSLTTLTEQLERVNRLLAATPAAAAAVELAPEGTPVSEPTPNSFPSGSPTSASEPSHRDEPVLAITVTPVVGAKPKNDVCKDAIMDPFFIPADGYSALADAMDEGRLE